MRIIKIIILIMILSLGIILLLDKIGVLTITQYIYTLEITLCVLALISIVIMWIKPGKKDKNRSG